MGLRLTGIGTSDGSSFAGEHRIAPDQILRLGRGSDNDWILDDPHRHVSKNHCVIAFRSDHFVVTDLSTNGVYIGDDLAPIGRGVTRMLRSGDVLTIGHYRFAVQIEISAADEPVDIELASPSVSAILEGTAPSHETPIAAARGHAGLNWLSDIPVGTAEKARALRPASFDAPPDIETISMERAPELDTAHGPLTQQALSMSTVVRLPEPSRLLPLDWDKDDPEIKEAPAAVPAGLVSAELQRPVPAAQPPQATRASIATIRAAPEPTAAPGSVTHLIPILDPHVAAALKAVPAPPKETEVKPIVKPNPSAPPPQGPTIGQVVEARPVVPAGAAAEPSAPADSPAIAAGIFAVAQTLASAEPAPTQSAPSASEPSAQMLIRALLDGAGVADGAIEVADAAAYFSGLGQCLRKLAEVTQALAQAGAAIEAQMGVAGGADRPYSLWLDSADLRHVMQAVLQPDPATAQAGTAMHECLRDVHERQLALAGVVHDVLAEVAQRFHPETIAALADVGRRASLLPRKARLWDCYAATYDGLCLNEPGTAGRLLDEIAAASYRRNRSGD